MSNASGVSPIDHQRLAGKHPLRTPPARRDGIELRILPRIHGETADMAIVRAKLLTWWPRRVNRKDPWADARNWIWHVRAV